MRRRFSQFLFSVICALPQFMMAIDAQYENRVVEAIHIEWVNAEDVGSNQVLSRIKTAPGCLFSQTDFDNDLKTLALEYDHVDPRIDAIDGRLDITLKVWPKPVIRCIQWEGIDKVARNDLVKELGICAGNVFERFAFNQAFHKLKTYYVKKGFFEAEIDYSVTPDACSNNVDITITVKEGRSGRIKEIKFCGFSKCEEGEIVDMMVTKEYNIFLSWLMGTGTYNEDAIQVDEHRILNYLQNAGYADAQVVIDVTEAPQCDRIIITITADKGERYCIGKVTFHGNCVFDDTKVQNCFTVAEGDVFSPDVIRETAAALQDAYGRCGYIDAVIDFDNTLSDCGNIYDVNFRIEEGEQYRVGLIRVIGNTTTQTRVILHESLLFPGEVFNIDCLKATEKRLNNIGYFKNVNVYPAQPNELFGGDCHYRDVHIEVEECGTGNFSAFGGYSTTESLFGGFSITEKNFNRCGLKELFNGKLGSLRGAGEFLSFTLNIGLKSRSYVVSWTDPHFWDTQWAVGFDVDRSINHIVSNDYSIIATGLALHASYPLAEFLRFGTHYRIRNTSVDVRHGGDQSKQLIETANNPGLISAAGLHLGYDNVNDPVCPTFGIRSRLEGEYGGIGGDHHFWSVGNINTYYHPLWENGVVKLRADMRFISPIGGTTPNTMPLDERLFLGGDNGVRGYRPFAIGPKFKGTQDPKGGMSLQLLSAEYNHKVFSRLDGFLFFDAGSLAFQTWRFNRLRSAAGVGVRIKLYDQGPPITLGLGFPINPEDRGDVRRFFWSMGGRF